MLDGKLSILGSHIIACFFLVREAGKLSSSSVMISPTESLEDILYRKTKHVFDYPVRDMKGLQAGGSF